jgi:hypothetical protein
VAVVSLECTRIIAVVEDVAEDEIVEDGFWVADSFILLMWGFSSSYNFRSQLHMTSKSAQMREANTLRITSLKRRRWILTLIGGGIVVLGFIVKDVVMDALKYESDNIAMHVTALGSHYPVVSVNTTLLPVGEEALRVSGKLEELKRNDVVPPETIRAEDVHLTEIFNRAEQNFALISDLQDALPEYKVQGLVELRSKHREQLETTRLRIQAVQREERAMSYRQKRSILTCWTARWMF